MTSMIGRPLTFDEYPRMDASEAGRVAPTGYGFVEGVRIPCIVAGAASALTAAIGPSDTTLELVDASRFPAVPFTLQAGYERMLATDANGNALSVTRGHGSTEALPHMAGEPVFEVPSEYVYLVSDGPVHSIKAVSIDRVLQRDGFTAYTGQGADCHPSWPGKAVVAFDAGAFIGSQRNLTASDAVLRKQGETVTQGALQCSNPEAADSSLSSYITLSPSGQLIAWAGFAAEPLALRRTFKAVIENPSASAEARLTLILRSSDTGSVILLREAFIPASGAAAVCVEHTTTEGVVFALFASSGDARVYCITSATLRERVPAFSDALVKTIWPASRYSEPRLGDGLDSSALTLSDSGLQACHAGYPCNGPGDVHCQIAEVKLKNTSATAQAEACLALVQDGACLARSAHAIGPLAEETITLSHTGGGWGALVAVSVARGTLSVVSITKSVQYTTAATLSEASASPPAPARIALGSEVTVDASWSVDESGDYSGLGQPIERPDHVIKHFLIERMGFSSAEMEESSFGSAGALYASAIQGGYCFGFVMEGTRLASEWLRLMARESRSTLRYSAGKWKLDYVPDAAPDAVATISQPELAGEGAEFTFSMEPMRGVANLLLGRFRRNMSPEAREAGWLEAAEVSDAGSIASYGERMAEVRFEAVRGRAMAGHVMRQMLRERARPLLEVRMKVLYNHFGLEPGDTVELQGGLYSGRFYIESIRRIDMATAEVKARQWWG